MAVQTAGETGALKCKTFGQAVSKLGWSSSDNGLFAEEHPTWQRQSALQLALKAAAKPTGKNWAFGE